MGNWRRWCTVPLLFLSFAAHAQHEVVVSAPERQKSLAAAVSLEGLLRLDIAVTDPDGAAVSNLQKSDFTLTDDGHPRDIVAFRSPNVTYSPPERATAVIILLDTFDLEPGLANFEREQLAKFLRHNEGHLPRLVTLYSLDNQGFALRSRPTRDGNALATAVESGSVITRIFGPPGSKANAIAKDMGRYPPMTGLRALGWIAADQSTVPGHKLLLWIGPGFRASGTGSYVGLGSAKDGVTFDLHSLDGRNSLLSKAQWLSTCLRQARITLDTFSVGEDEESVISVQDPHVLHPAILDDSKIPIRAG